MQRKFGNHCPKLSHLETLSLISHSILMNDLQEYLHCEHFQFTERLWHHSFDFCQHLLEKRKYNFILNLSSAPSHTLIV